MHGAGLRSRNAFLVIILNYTHTGSTLFDPNLFMSHFFLILVPFGFSKSYDPPPNFHPHPSLPLLISDKSLIHVRLALNRGLANCAN